MHPVTTLSQPQLTWRVWAAGRVNGNHGERTMMIVGQLVVEFLARVERVRRFWKPSSYGHSVIVAFVQCELVPVCCCLLLWLA